jgi:hypothetical protein
MSQDKKHKRQQSYLRIPWVTFQLVGFCLSTSFSPLMAQNLNATKYKFQPRRNAHGVIDRDEGLQPTPIAGERLDLVGAFLRAAHLPEPGAIHYYYRLGFVLPQDEPRVVITV